MPDALKSARAIIVNDVSLVGHNPRRILGELLGRGEVDLTGTLGVLAGEQPNPGVGAGLVVSNHLAWRCSTWP